MIQSQTTKTQQKARRWRLSVVVLAAVLTALAVTHPDSQATWLPHRPEFAATARRLTRSSNAIVGTARVDQLERLLRTSELSDSMQMRAQLDLVSELARVGRVNEAVKLADQALDRASVAPGLDWLLPEVHHARGLAYLRLAEVENCIARHNAECCVFPLAGGGVHVEKAPARTALESYLFCLESDPDNLRFRWLANLAAMALGEHPQVLPEPVQIPRTAFDSEDDVGRFPDIAPRLGLDTVNLCGGAIAQDFDNDGFLDIVTSSFDPLEPLRYFRNRGDGSFVDRSDRSRSSDQLGGLNCIAGDYDNDGRIDVFVLRGAWLHDDGRIRNSLLRNRGDGVFEDVTVRAGLANHSEPTQAAAFGDFDNDGDLDLYVGNESRVEIEPESVQGDYPSRMFRNNGDGTFTDVAPELGVTNDRYCKGVAAGDYDNDGDLDIYVSNVGPNRLYRQNADGTFTDVAESRGVTAPDGRSFAAWFFDYDNDGWLDLFVAGFEASVEDVAADLLGRPHHAANPALYRNNRDGSFTDVTARVGLAHPYLPMGANFGDVDNDGWLDIYLATGDPELETLMPNVMLRNESGRRFLNVTTSGGFGHLQKGHGVAFADLDNDGDQDIFNQLGGFYAGDKFANALFLNPGHGNKFLRIELRGEQTNQFGLGARIHLTLATPSGRRHIHRAVGAVSSFGGSPFRQEIGLGDATAIERLEIWWPASNTRQYFTDVPMNSAVLVSEGVDTLIPRPLNAINFE